MIVHPLIHVISRKRTGDISILFAKNLPKLCVTFLNRAVITYNIFIHEDNYLDRKKLLFTWIHMSRSWSAAGIKAFLNQGHIGTRLNMVTSTRILVAIETLAIRLFCWTFYLWITLIMYQMMYQLITYTDSFSAYFCRI